MGTIGIIYSFYYQNIFIFFIITQLIFGINRALFSSYRTVFIANMTSSTVKDFNKHNYYYSLIYFATPIGSFLLAFFGILLEDYSFTFAMLVFAIPCIVSTFLLLFFIPHNAHSNLNSNSFINVANASTNLNAAQSNTSNNETTLLAIGLSNESINFHSISIDGKCFTN